MLHFWVPAKRKVWTTEFIKDDSEEMKWVINKKPDIVARIEVGDPYGYWVKLVFVLKEPKHETEYIVRYGREYQEEDIKEWLPFKQWVKKQWSEDYGYLSPVRRLVWR